MQDWPVMPKKRDKELSMKRDVEGRKLKLV